MAPIDLGTDLSIIRSPNQVAGTLDLNCVNGDLTLVSGMDNLVQALTLRLMTIQGELAQLGHPEYGSRLYLLVGRIMGDEVISLAKAYSREALRDESRISPVFDVSVFQLPNQRDILYIQMDLQVAITLEPIQLALSFDLRSGQTGVMTNAIAG